MMTLDRVPPSFASASQRKQSHSCNRQQEHLAVFIHSLFSGIFLCLIALSAGFYLIYRHSYFLAFSGMFLTLVLIQLEINGLLLLTSGHNHRITM